MKVFLIMTVDQIDYAKFFWNCGKTMSTTATIIGKNFSASFQRNAAKYGRTNMSNSTLQFEYSSY